ncbi:hypothetical protein [Devosia enhydra]|uniref:hypothetical protein n=1 Tax=Devosia enhydra TaxID=665118 RepID=UPI00093132AE|nr:hypothetical protein [Devosia enhydra]
MNAFEGFTEAKNPGLPQTNEDQIVVVPGAGFAVIDGATDITGKRFDDRLGAGATGGRLAAMAIAEAFRALFSVPATLHAPGDLAAAATRAVAALYDRLGLSALTAASGDHRFRAGFVAAYSDGETLRLVKVGDCGIRIDGREILSAVFPGDVVLSAARAHAFAILKDRGADAATARTAARSLIVNGLAARTTPPEGLSAADIAYIRALVGSDAEASAAVLGDQHRLTTILDAGLSGIRHDPAAYNALVIDGVDDVTPVIRSLDVPQSDWSLIELHSDGYPVAPSATGIAAWEEALAEADRVDPERVGPHRSTKGRIGGNFGDDRSIVVISKGRGR